MIIVMDDNDDCRRDCGLLIFDSVRFAVHVRLVAIGIRFVYFARSRQSFASITIRCIGRRGVGCSHNAVERIAAVLSDVVQ